MTNNDAYISGKKVSSSPSAGLHEQYRQILGAANKLEIILTKVNSVIDLLVTPLVSSLCSKLCRDCLELFLNCDFKLEHFRKAEELLWKRIYYDIYRLLRTKRHFVRKQDEYLVESHFMSGIGFYSNLIIRLRLQYKIDNVPGAIAPLNLSVAPLDDLLEPNKHATGFHQKKCKKGNNDEGNETIVSESISVEDENEHDSVKLITSAQQWARQAIYRSIIYMGDLSRYLLELSDYDDRRLAYELYRSASHYQSECGLPFNQLATLCGGTNYNLDAVCNYMRCCSRPKPFDRAEGNLVKIFELNGRHYDELTTIGAHKLRASSVLASKDPVLEVETIMRSAIISFIKLTSELWIAGENLPDENFSKIITDSRFFDEILSEAMELEPIVPFVNPTTIEQDFYPVTGCTSDQEKPKYMSPTIMYEFCSISLMLIARRQSLYANLGNIDDLVKTLALDLLMRATVKCRKMVMNRVQELRINLKDRSTFDQRFMTKPASESSLVTAGNSSPNLSVPRNRRVLTRIRQKEAVSKYTTDLSRVRTMMGQDEESDLSELEETALSTIDALDISSEMSDNADYQVDDLINLDSSEEDETKFKISDENAADKRDERRATSQRRDLDLKKEQPTSSHNSLPVDDLLTGEVAEMSFQTAYTSYDISGPSSEIESEIPCVAARMNLIETTYAYLYNSTYLPAIKVYLDWLLSNAEIINSHLEMFRMLQDSLNSIVELFDELTRLTGIHDLTLDAGSIFRHTYTGPEWSQRFPLSCDRPFVNLQPLRGAHQANIDFTLDKELDDAEHGFVTVQCVAAFADALAIFLKNKSPT